MLVERNVEDKGSKVQRHKDVVYRWSETAPSVLEVPDDFGIQLINAAPYVFSEYKNAIPSEYKEEKKQGNEETTKRGSDLKELDTKVLANELRRRGFSVRTKKPQKPKRKKYNGTVNNT